MLSPNFAPKTSLPSPSPLPALLPHSLSLTSTPALPFASPPLAKYSYKTLAQLLDPHSQQRKLISAAFGSLVQTAGRIPPQASAYRGRHCNHCTDLKRERRMFSWISSTLGYAGEDGSGSHAYGGRKSGEDMRWGPGPLHPQAAGPGVAAAAFYHSAPPGGEPPAGRNPPVRRWSGRGETPPADGSMDDVNFFLQHVRRAVQFRHQTMKFTVVMGNEACDLDSMVSAIAYARLLSSKASDDSGAPSSCYVPFMAIRREDLALRTEAFWLFQSSGLDIDSLVFLGDLDLEELRAKGGLRLILVDHNRLAARQESLQDAIVEIVDHHVDEGLYPHVALKTIAGVCSCSTLVAEKISEESPELLMGRGLNKLLLAAILVDSSNLSLSITRVSPRDETMAALLLNGAGHLGRNGFYEKLKERKYDLSGLSTQDLLRKDYKQWTMGPGISGDLGPKGRKTVVGVSSIGFPLQKMVAKDLQAGEAIEGFRKAQDVDVLVLMASYYPQAGVFKRELAIVASDQPLVTRLGTFLASSAAQLSLKSSRVGGWEGEGSLPEGAKAYSQGNTQASRKKLQPLLVEFFAN